MNGLCRQSAVCILLLYCLAITGCMNLPAKNIDAGAGRIPPGAGVMVGSVTQTSDGIPSPYHDMAVFVFTREGDDRHPLFSHFRVKSAKIVRTLFGPNSSLADRGLEDRNGTLFAVPLEPGTYRLVCFYIDAPGYRCHYPESSISFKVSAEEVVYIGNLDASFCIRHAYANQAGIAGVNLSVNGRSDRDLPLLREKFSVLRTLPITNRTLDNTAMQQQLGYLSHCCKQQCSGKQKWQLDL